VGIRSGKRGLEAVKKWRFEPARWRARRVDFKFNLIRLREDSGRRERHVRSQEALCKFRNHPHHGVVLFIVNLLAVHREHDAKDAASASLKLADATNDVRFQMMQNRLYLSNYCSAATAGKWTD